MKNSLIFSSLIVFCTLSSNSNAEGFSYSHLDVEYSHLDEKYIDNPVAFDGTVSLNDQVYLTGGYQFSGIKTYYGDIDVSQIKAGVGMHTPLADGTDVLFEGALLRLTAEAVGQSQSEMGYEISTGVRHKLNQHLEGNAGISFASIPDADIDGFSIDVGGRLYFNGSLSAGAHYVIPDEGDGLLRSSLRFDFL